MAVDFLVYDIVFLVIFVIFLFIFLHSGKKNLKREGLLLLYKTSWGIKLINKIGKKNPGVFKVLSYVSIATGYLLMALMIYMLAKIVHIYISAPEIVRAVKVPPIIPLVPYLPQIFSLDFLPPFYFTYWIVIIAVIAITHEFSHGIFAAYNNLKIKTTGFGFFPWFLPVFLAAFVELDEKKMEKKKNFPQLAILSAGTFANVLTAIFFFVVIWIFFFAAFTPSGVIFNTYPYSVVDISSISSVNGIQVGEPTYEKISELLNVDGLNKVEANGIAYVTTKDISYREGIVVLYYDAPAINANLESVIFGVNGVNVKSVNELSSELSKYSPGEKITLKVLGEDGEGYDIDIVLGKNPINENLAWLGIGFTNQERDSTLGKLFLLLSFKDPNIYYEAKFDGLSVFIYNLLWWVVLISVSVALINMLPVGIFDGGRFFYLTVLGITKSEKIAKLAFSLSTYAILFILFLLLFFWAIAVI